MVETVVRRHLNQVNGSGLLLVKAREPTDLGWPDVASLHCSTRLVTGCSTRCCPPWAATRRPSSLPMYRPPVFCVQGMYSTGRAHPQLVEWMAVTEHIGTPVIADLFETR